jgi:hypothetical protein
MALNTIVQQPTDASLLATDYFLTWQGSQSPSTRKTPVSQLATYYAYLSSANTFADRITVSSGGIGVTGNSSITGTLSVSSSFTIAAGGLTVTTGGASISNTGGWSSSNVGKQLLITTPAAASNPGIGITDLNGTNLWGIWNSAGTLRMSSMPAYSNGALPNADILSLSTAGAAVTGTLTSSGALTVSAGGAAVTGTLAVTGAATVSSTLGVSGNATVGGTLTVTGVITPTGGLANIDEETDFNIGSFSGHPTVNFAANQFMQFQSGVGLVINTTGALTIDAPSGMAIDGTLFSDAQTVALTGAGTLVSYAAPGPVGSVSTNGATTTYNTTSDQRLKIDDGAILDSASIIDALKPRWFRWKSEPNTESVPGFFAQQVARVFPWAVTKGIGNVGSKAFVPWMMDASTMMPMVIAELQALRRRVKELEAR